MTESDILVTMLTYSKLYLEKRIEAAAEIGDFNSIDNYKKQLEEFTLFYYKFSDNLYK